jgi:hypothetical protein
MSASPQNEGTSSILGADNNHWETDPANKEATSPSCIIFIFSPVLFPWIKWSLHNISLLCSLHGSSGQSEAVCENPKKFDF